MSTNLGGVGDAIAHAIAEIEQLRQFDGPPKQFWPRFLTAIGNLVGAQNAALMVGAPGKSPRWNKMSEWSPATGQARLRADFSVRLESNAERCVDGGDFVTPVDPAAGVFTAAVRLKLARPEEEAVLVCQLADFTDEAANDAFARLRLAADTPRVYLAHLASTQARNNVEKFAAVLDLIAPVNSATHRVVADLAFCNAIASRFRCERTSLGWIVDGYVRLQAISRTENFDRKMTAAQNHGDGHGRVRGSGRGNSSGPQSDGATSIARDHEKFATEHKPGHLCSVPLRIDGKLVAVLTLRAPVVTFRHGRTPATPALRAIRSYADSTIYAAMIAGLGRAGLARARESFAHHSSGRSTLGVKSCAIGGAVLLAVLIFVKVDLPCSRAISFCAAARRPI